MKTLKSTIDPNTVKAERTPGPWRIAGEGWKPWEGAIEVSGGGGETVAWTPSGSGFEAEDARLIAAAPDMLDALKTAKNLADVMESMTACRSDDDWVWAAQAKINAAIAKAEGRS